MAQIGLKFDNDVKTRILGKDYLLIQEGIQNLKELLGKVRFVDVVRNIMETEDDTTRPRDRDGRYPQINTGTILGVELALVSETQQDSIFVSIPNMTASEVEEMGLKFQDEVELDHLMLALTGIADNPLKFFAEGLKKVGQPQAQPKQDHKEHKDNNHKG